MKYYINQMNYKNIQTVISTLKIVIYYCSFFILISCSSTIEFSFSNEEIKDDIQEDLSMNLHQGKVFFLFENSMNDVKVSILSHKFGVYNTILNEVIKKSNKSDFSKIVGVFNGRDYLLLKINNITVELPVNTNYNYRFVFIKRCPKNKRKFIITFTNEISQEVLSQI
ncbi:hypothetical protein [Flavobacterium tibetense]|uniref:Lipoprotein n=1 Tax=Flavobacterium tibetense TaxID=2233533 RepID=A0A365NZE4_9FLAO|nr:hypothetical protein [Flavobacterium tibetense]RBA27636.1 hypothetical protein DPN68_11235 [Flavobacterium tibetense]